MNPPGRASAAARLPRCCVPGTPCAAAGRAFPLKPLRPSTASSPTGEQPATASTPRSCMTRLPKCHLGEGTSVPRTHHNSNMPCSTWPPVAPPRAGPAALVPQPVVAAVVQRQAGPGAGAQGRLALAGLLPEQPAALVGAEVRTHVWRARNFLPMPALMAARTSTRTLLDMPCNWAHGRASPMRSDVNALGQALAVVLRGI